MTVGELIEKLEACESYLTVFTVESGYNAGGDDFYEADLTAVEEVDNYGENWARNTEGKRAVKLIF